MIDPAEKKAAYRAMGKSVPESDIDRLAEAARAQAKRASDRHARPDASLMVDRGGAAVLAEPVETAPAPILSAKDFTVIALYLGLGVFTRTWTNVTVEHNFAGDVQLFAFAVAIILALHGVIFAVAYGAWRANWELRSRNFMAMAAVAGYLGTHLLTAL